MPHGIMTEVSKNERSGHIFNAKPCVVIHLDDETPTAAIFLPLTQTPKGKNQNKIGEWSTPDTLMEECFSETLSALTSVLFIAHTLDAM